MCSYQDPFEDYKVRLAKKLAKRAEAENSAKTQKVEKREGDDVNWFGVKVGTGDSAFGGGATGGGVGKYLNSLKRPSSDGIVVGGGGEDKKKRKIGFGNFEGW